MKVVRSFPLGSAQLDRRWARVEMTRDGSKVVASWMEGPTRHVVVNGRSLGHGDTGEFDRNYERAAWLIRSADGVYVESSSGARSGPHQGARFGGRAFSDDGRRLTYAFQTRGGDWYVQVDDGRFGPYAAVQGPGFDRGSSVSTWKFQQRDGSWWLQVEKAQYGPSPDDFRLPKVRADGRLVSVDRRAGESVIRIDDREFGPYAGEKVDFAFNAQGDRLAVARHSGGKQHVLLEGAPIGSFDLVVTLKGFSPDGTRFGFGFEEGKRHGFWIDGVRHDGFLYTDGPYWSADSRHVAWGASTDRGRSCVFVDGVMLPLEHEIAWEEGSEFTFAPDGRFCLVLQDRRRDVNLILVGGASYEVGRPRHGCRAEPGSRPCVLFSRDGSRFALGGSFGAPSGDCVEWTGGRAGPFETFDYTLTPDGELLVATLDVDSGEVRVLSAQL